MCPRRCLFYVFEGCWLSQVAGDGGSPHLAATLVLAVASVKKSFLAINQYDFLSYIIRWALGFGSMVCVAGFGLAIRCIYAANVGVSGGNVGLRDAGRGFESQRPAGVGYLPSLPYYGCPQGPQVVPRSLVGFCSKNPPFSEVWND